MISLIKQCTRCGLEKSTTEFHKLSSNKDGVNYSCKKCVNSYQRSRNLKRDPAELKNNNLRHNYGITLDEYNIILKGQNNVCKICSSICTVRSCLAVDHDYKTGKIRGLLCHECNTGLGKFKDNPDLLILAGDYLKCSE